MYFMLRPSQHVAGATVPPHSLFVNSRLSEREDDTFIQTKGENKTKLLPSWMEHFYVSPQLGRKVLASVAAFK